MITTETIYHDVENPADMTLEIDQVKLFNTDNTVENRISLEIGDRHNYATHTIHLSEEDAIELVNHIQSLLASFKPVETIETLNLPK